MFLIVIRITFEEQKGKIMKSEILSNFLQAQETTKERISLDFTAHKTIEFWHFMGINSDTESFCISSEDISLEEFNKQMVVYLLKNC